jgi:hypothetical protein
MKQLLSLLLLFSYLSNCSAQSEDCRLKVKYNGYSDGAYSVTVTNKTNCASTYQFIDPGNMTMSLDTIVQPGECKIILIRCNLACGSIKVIPLSSDCVSSCPVNYVQTNNVCSPLSVKLSNQSVRKISNNRLQVTFKIEEASNVRNLIFNTTTDGKIFIKRHVVSATDFKPGTFYSVIFNY